MTPIQSRPGARTWIYVVSIGAVFMIFLDPWVVTVALDSMSTQFPGSSLSSLSWVLNAYTIAMAALLVIAGRMGDRRGNETVLLTAVVLFTVAPPYAP